MAKLINKLVRDRIPSICGENGQVPKSRILESAEYTRELRRKLKEEVEEYLASNEPEELADIVEVIEALAEDQGISFDDIMRMKQKKQDKNGAFRDKVFLISVEDLHEES